MLADTTYNKDSLPIFQSRCSACHNSSYEPRNWLDYKIAFEKREEIKKRVYTLKSMPPSGFNIKDEERETLKNWVDEGGKE